MTHEQAVDILTGYMAWLSSDGEEPYDIKDLPDALTIAIDAIKGSNAVDHFFHKNRLITTTCRMCGKTMHNVWCATKFCPDCKELRKRYTFAGLSEDDQKKGNPRYTKQEDDIIIAAYRSTSRHLDYILEQLPHRSRMGIKHHIRELQRKHIL